MKETTTVETLEQALFDRAKRLAEEYLARARQTRERMVEEENERLRLREERETLAAEAEAERLYRRRVQAVELQFQGELDRRRWDLMQAVKADIGQRFEEYRNTDAYQDSLRRLLAEAVTMLGEEAAVAELCGTDRERLADGWEDFIAQAVPGRSVRLDETPGDFAGGALVRSADDSVRVDNSFEGRMERFEDQINQAIAEALFPGSVATEAEPNV